ncbi:alpha/beta fold hydrolase [Halorientalis marina]|jgi:pimeloyl-ACP methyl ester carboxylesterase|uniref:alpha/beta fold hydrolase n=1 Tax=Halorientalis marina TaxID=2931976 RepID=UPI001FF35F69|nr:alpha/beta hydrolase [Halorientalis marina]
MTPAPESKSVSVSPETGEDETNVRYLEAGEGPPVVLLHGVGLDAAAISWKHAIPELAENHRVIAPDLPGHGESDKPQRRYTTDYYIDVLDELVAELALDTPQLAGISMGGGIALGYALENEVERLALVDSYGLGSDAPWRPAAAMALRIPVVDRMVWESMGVNEGTVRDTLRGYMTQASEEFVAEIHEILQNDDCGRTLRSWQRSEFQAFGFRTCYLEELAELSTPTLLIHGADDTLLPASWSRRADDRLPESELHVFEDCGHWPPRERPATFNDRLTTFFAS